MGKIKSRHVLNLMLLLLALLGIAGICQLAGCGFYHATTPAGIPCPDIPLLNKGEDIHSYTHRHAIHTAMVANITGSERKEQLRKLACDDRADAVVEITQEAHLLPGGDASVIVLTGFTARWKGGALK